MSHKLLQINIEKIFTKKIYKILINYLTVIFFFFNSFKKQINIFL